MTEKVRSDEDIIKISICGKSVCVLGWDASMKTDDPNDPEWNIINAAIEKHKYVKKGLGYTITFEVSRKLAHVVLDYLQDVGEMYDGPGMDFPGAGGALLHDADRLRKVLA